MYGRLGEKIDILLAVKRHACSTSTAGRDRACALLRFSQKHTSCTPRAQDDMLFERST